MPEASIFDQILDPANRADPYPLYAELRKTPVTRQADGTYVVSTYDEIVALLHDPRVSSDPHRHPGVTDATPAADEGPPDLPPAFINRDPPEHDRLRELAMRRFGPPCTPGWIEGMRPWPQPRRHRRRLRLPAAGDSHLPDPRRPPRGPAALPRVGRRDHRDH